MKALLYVSIPLLLCSSAAFADKIYLKGGKILKTTIIKEDEQCVMVENEDTWQKISKCDIELVRKADQPPADPTPPVPAPVQTAVPESDGTRSSKPAAADQMSSAGIGILLEGTIVKRVVPGAPASKAGVLEGDRIVAVDGENIVYSSILKKRLRGEAGTEVTVRVLRTGVIEPITMTLIREDIEKLVRESIISRETEPISQVMKR